MRMAEPRGDGDLAGEPLGPDRIGELGPEHLEGDLRSCWRSRAR